MPIGLMLILFIIVLVIILLLINPLTRFAAKKLRDIEYKCDLDSVGITGNFKAFGASLRRLESERSKMFKVRIKKKFMLLFGDTHPSAEERIEYVNNRINKSRLT